MATTKKAKSEEIKAKTSVLKKTVNGYNYKYTDLAGIHEYLEKSGLSYWQEVEVSEHGDEYIKTHILDSDGNEIRAVKGCKIISSSLQGKSNAVQEYGSGITYARRYSLMMALGLATEDDDGEIATKPKGQKSGGLDFTEIRKEIKTAISMEQLVGIYNKIPAEFQKYFMSDFKKAKEDLGEK